jgi:trimeric autotransporter adhesin
LSHRLTFFNSPNLLTFSHFLMKTFLQLGALGHPDGNRPKTGARTMLRRLLATATLGLLGTGAAQAQFNYQAVNALNTTSTFTSIAATGSSIATANTDDANSGTTPLGFTFNYNGLAFTDFVLNTNGFLKLGTVPPSTAALFYTGAQNTVGGPTNSADPADVNLVMPFATDLTAGSAGGTGYQVQTTGTAPNRICTVQWTNVQDAPPSFNHNT